MGRVSPTGWEGMGHFPAEQNHSRSKKETALPLTNTHIPLC